MIKEGLYLVDYEVENYNPVIYMFSRLHNGEKKIERITDFKPYFYVLKNQEIPPQYKTEYGYKSLFGDEVKKVICNLPSEVSLIRSSIDKTFEADILFNNRFLIDKIDNIIESKYKIFYLDIETLSVGGFPDVKTANQPIVCLTIYNNFSEKYVTWIWRNDFHNEIIEDKDKILKKFKTEKEMLEDFKDYIKQESPDIITGWNIRFFDMKYLINRMKNKIMKIDVSELSPLRRVYVTEDRPGIMEGKIFSGDPVIKGIVIFDMLNFYRKVHKGELSSYSLNSVAVEELGEEKTDSHHVIDKDWKDDWMNVVKYNQKDVELTVKINLKTGLINFFDEMRILTHVNFDDCKYYGRIVDVFILKYAKQKNIILPSKKPYNPNRELEGGYVREPTIGLHENVIVIDLNTLYPSLIETFNLSPETRVDDGEININGIRYTKKFKGIMPSILNELSTIRTEYKKKMKQLRMTDPEFKIYDAKQQAAKNLICTVYGVNALSTFRLNTDYVAQTITYLGRELNKWLSEIIEEKGHKVIYGDTDSVFVQIKNTNDFIEKGNKLANYLNGRLHEFAERYGTKEHTLKLDFEKAFKRIIISAKKRYAALICWKDGAKDDAIYIVGFDSKRSDTSSYSKDIQRTLFNMILKGDNQDKVINYLDDMVKNIKKQLPDKIAIPVKFEKSLDSYKTNIPRVRGAKLANNILNTNFNAGNKILMLYIKGKKGIDDAICFENNKQFKDFNVEIDYKKLIDKLILMKIKRLFFAIKWENEFNYLSQKYLKGDKSLNDFIK